MGRINRYVLLWLTAFFVVWNGKNICKASKEEEKCLAVITPDFDDCDKLRHQHHSYGQCSNATVCKKHFKFSEVSIEPFLHILENVVANVLEICCGSCGNVLQYDTQTVAINNLTRSLMNASNFIFPVLGLHDENNIYGYHFIPLLELSSGYYITKAVTPKEVMDRLTRSCLNLWPLLIIIILLSVITGFVMWLMETWFNKEEFSRWFFIGLFDGFWWSFVSMTTVGYGDKTPKFIISRLFSVFWVIIGITICSIFTASLTNEITSASNPADPEMHGKIVGVLKYRTFDASFVAKHGGSIKETKGTSEEDNIRDIKRMLSDGKVSGIFMDKYTYMHPVTVAKEATGNFNHTHSGPADVAQFFLEETHRVKQAFEGERMSYGVLVREEDDYKFFEEFIRHNQAVYETCALLQLNEGDEIEDHDHNIFSPEGGQFYYFLYSTVGVIAGILLFGIIFEVIRKARGSNQRVEDIPS